MKSASTQNRAVEVTDQLRRNVKWFRGGLVSKAHRLLYQSTTGSREIKKKVTTLQSGLCSIKSQRISMGRGLSRQAFIPQSLNICVYSPASQYMRVFSSLSINLCIPLSLNTCVYSLVSQCMCVFPGLSMYVLIPWSLNICFS